MTEQRDREWQEVMNWLRSVGIEPWSVVKAVNEHFKLQAKGAKKAPVPGQMELPLEILSLPE
jgi:hypothetical protein